MAHDTSNSLSTPKNEYPGFGRPLRILDNSRFPFYPIGAHVDCTGTESELVPVRELAMMDVMEKLTDKENWHRKVFDEDIVAKWRKEALAVPDADFWTLATYAKLQMWPNDDGPPVFENPSSLECGLTNIMDEATFQSCIEELRSKAKYFELTGIIPTLDASASIAKSDVIVPAGLQEDLRIAFDKLKTDCASSPDWHPNSGDMVQDLIHPSMYPLVYGRSRGFRAEKVGVTDAIRRWAGKGDIIPKLESDALETALANQPSFPNYDLSTDHRIPAEYWSDTYQWLPANVAFGEGGKVKFTSYINNLHPTKYPDIYRIIERLIETSIPMWDQCLRMATDYGECQGAGRLAPRADRPEDVSDEEMHLWIPDNIEACADEDVDMSELVERGYDEEFYASREERRQEDYMQYKWETLRKPKIPAIPFKEVDYAPKAGQLLAERFAASGLQVIVKMASIELTPEKPEFPVGGWHVEGQMNEKICATALYYLDSDNITDDSLSFRMQIPEGIEEDFEVGQDAYHWLEQIYGTALGCGNGPRLQNYGSVQTRQGRLLAFPNVFQHRVSSFKLIDPTKPGHRRFIALWLVDPTKRIISTANIPPQQMSWYTESIFGSSEPAQQATLEELPPDIVELLVELGWPGLTNNRECRLPEELMDFVRAYLKQDKFALPMTVQEANEHRLKLMRERSAFVKKSEEGWQRQTYSFCEH
ncbi:hypothetical protein COCCADRAFT_97087 [Bipolaris zeicola 26-R-13]|uniref:Uncharacterized protein n=1 Tax=Cochliobolus carbonum (strain 26-R-13) TaxID=930089 RepID=W6XZZ1_COCC2|nr:uncharacterized protein COCCADRAFT_97087 [Bipolaris zeicola 26-R-13]EUC33067.1 hypothetical protein COCCADRAFT_97087 [Bipolaris zeicola 26-R-13]